MAFYYDNRYGDIVFSEHEIYGGNIHFPRESRPAMHEWALFNQLVSDLPNMYGDLYETFKAKGDDMSDPFWKRENMKEVRAARDRGDRSDRSIWPQIGYGGTARDAWGYLRDPYQPGALTRVSEPLFGGNPMDPWSYQMQPGDQLYWVDALGSVPMFFPY